MCGYITKNVKLHFPGALTSVEAPHRPDVTSRRKLCSLNSRQPEYPPATSLLFSSSGRNFMTGRSLMIVITVIKQTERNSGYLHNFMNVITHIIKSATLNGGPTVAPLPAERPRIMPICLIYVNGQKVG